MVVVYGKKIMHNLLCVTIEHLREVINFFPSFVLEYESSEYKCSSCLQVKLSLPVQLHNQHHLFFRFYHISCEASKSGSRLSSTSVKKKDGIETSVGYAWMPILHDGRCVGIGVLLFHECVWQWHFMF